MQVEKIKSPEPVGCGTLDFIIQSQAVAGLQVAHVAAAWADAEDLKMVFI